MRILYLGVYDLEASGCQMLLPPGCFKSKKFISLLAGNQNKVPKNINMYWQLTVTVGYCQ